MSNKVLITNSQKAVKVPSGLRILIRRACNAVHILQHLQRVHQTAAGAARQIDLGHIAGNDHLRAYAHTG